MLKFESATPEKGLAPELLPHIFDRFRQGDSGTTKPDQGLGLGFIRIVYHLVQLHRGNGGS